MRYQHRTIPAASPDRAQRGTGRTRPSVDCREGSTGRSHGIGPADASARASWPRGSSGSTTAKTAMGVIRYGRDQVVAVIDSTQAGRNVREWLGDSGRFDIPIVASLDEALGFMPARQRACSSASPRPAASCPDAWRADDPRRHPRGAGRPVRAAHVHRRRPGVRRGGAATGRPDHRLPAAARAARRPSVGRKHDPGQARDPHGRHRLRDRQDVRRARAAQGRGRAGANRAASSPPARPG